MRRVLQCVVWGGWIWLGAVAFADERSRVAYANTPFQIPGVPQVVRNSTVEIDQAAGHWVDERVPHLVERAHRARAFLLIDWERWGTNANGGLMQMPLLDYQADQWRRAHPGQFDNNEDLAVHVMTEINRGANLIHRINPGQRTGIYYTSPFKALALFERLYNDPDGRGAIGDLHRYHELHRLVMPLNEFDAVCPDLYNTWGIVDWPQCAFAWHLHLDLANEYGVQVIPVIGLQHFGHGELDRLPVGPDLLRIQLRWLAKRVDAIIVFASREMTLDTLRDQVLVLRTEWLGLGRVPAPGPAGGK